MGYNTVSGTLYFDAPLNDDQLARLKARIRQEDGEHGVADWWPAAGGSGLVCRWEDSFKAYWTKEGLDVLLSFLREMGVGWSEGGRFRCSGEDPGDIVDWVVKPGEVVAVEQDAVMVFDRQEFAALFIIWAQGALRDEHGEDWHGWDVLKAELRNQLELWNEDEPETEEAEDDEEEDEEEDE